MSDLSLHHRLIKWRDRAWRRKSDLPVYAHMLVMSHGNGELVAKDHPAWARLDKAIAAARDGDETALDMIEREAVRLRDTT